MKKIIEEWKEYLSEQAPTRASSVRKINKHLDFKNVGKVVKKLEDEIKKIPAGFTHPGQPRLTRTSLSQGISSDIVDYGPAKLDQVLAWAVSLLKGHAEILGIIPDDSRYFMPAGPTSGQRSDKTQEAKFINKFNKLNQELKNGAKEIKRGRYSITRKNGKFFLNKKPIKNLAWAIHMVARQEIARPHKMLSLAAFDNSKYKTKPGDPKHLTGRTIDFALQGDAGRLNMKLNNAAHQSNTGQFLRKYGPMYGLINYGSESWHWEMNAENRAYFLKMKKDGITPIQSALSTIAARDLKKTAAE
jgi:hypothetical protein